MAASLPHLINEEFLTCKVCLDTFTQPKTLSCLHTFCLHCLEQYTAQNDAETDLCCPICRQMTHLGDGGLRQLRDNFFIASLQDAIQTENYTPETRLCDSCKCRGEDKAAEKRCLNCREFLCHECVIAHQRLNLTKNHMTIEYRKEAKRISVNEDIAPESARGELAAVVTCKQHPYEESKLYCEDCAAPICIPCKLTNHDAHKCCNIETAVHLERDSLQGLGDHLKERISEYEKMKSEWEEYKQDLENQDRSLMKKVQTRREDILRAIDEWYQMLKKKVRDNFWQEKHFVSSKTSAVQKQLDTYRAVMEHLDIVLTATRPTQLLGLTAQLKDELHLNVLAEDDLSTLTLTMKMVIVEMFSNDKTSSAIALSTDLLGTMATSYSKVTQNPMRFIKKLTLIRQFPTRPAGICKCRFDASSLMLNSDDQLVVTDRQLDKVSIYSHEGKLQANICTTLMGKPLCGIQLPSGDIVIVREKPSLCVFGINGNDKRIIKEALSRPCCITLTHDGNFMVLDYDLRVVTTFCGKTFAKLSHVRVQYSKGSKLDKLAVKQNGHFYICVHKDSCIHEFSPRGRRLASYGHHGNSEPGELYWPRGLAMDHYGNLITVDSGNSLQFVSVKGTWLYLNVGKTLQNPTDVAMTRNGLICVLESTGIVKVFKYSPF